MGKGCPIGHNMTRQKGTCRLESQHRQLMGWKTRKWPFGLSSGPTTQQRGQPRGSTLSSDLEEQPDLRAWSRKGVIPQKLFSNKSILFLRTWTHVGCSINTMEKDIVVYKHNKKKHLILYSQILTLQNHYPGSQARVFGSRWIYGPSRGKYGERSNVIRCHLCKVWRNDWRPYCLTETSALWATWDFSGATLSTQRPTHPREGSNDRTEKWAHPSEHL